MAKKRVLITGAAGYVASRMLTSFHERYDLTLLDSTVEPSPDRLHSGSGMVSGVQVADLLDPDRSKYSHHFEGVDAVVHLAYIRRRGEPIDQYESQRENVDMAYNVFRAAYDAGVERVVAASSNHAANWYEPALLQPRKMESLDPYDLPLSHNFYGWSKATYEHLGFLFACGAFGRKMGMVLVRIGSPGELDVSRSSGNETGLKRGLGSYLSQRDQTSTVYEGNRDREHRKRARSSLARRVWHQQQYEGVLVAGQREESARILLPKTTRNRASPPICRLAKRSDRAGRVLDDSRSVRVLRTWPFAQPFNSFLGELG